MISDLACWRQSYKLTLARPLELRGLHVQRQVSARYQGQSFDEGLRVWLIVELKSVERVTPAHKKQLLTYLRLTGLKLFKLGYLLNFGEALMRDGITRSINGHLDSDPQCLGASVRVEFIEPSAGPDTLPRLGQP